MTQPSQMSYTDAAVAAAALYAAAKVAPNPLDTFAATARSAAMVTASAQAAAVTAIRALWAGTNPYDDRAVTKFAASAGEVMRPTQQAVARVTAAARTQQLRTAGVQATIVPNIPDDVRGTTARITAASIENVRPEPPPETPGTTTPSEVARPSEAPRARVTVDGERVSPHPTPERSRVRVTYADGGERVVPRSSAVTSRVFVRVAETYRYSQSQGTDHETANRAAQNRIDALVDGNLQVVRASVEYQSLTQVVDLDRPIIGYRRIIHPELSTGGVCGMCIVAADRVYKIAELKAIHLRCKCAVLEIYEDYDPGHELNGQDLKKLYDAAGGNDRKALKRTRYKIEEHAELGPMLVPVKGSPIPYFPVPADARALVPA